ncbi:MAG: Polysaccharide biosynthesis protein [archaeon ADurb.Bin336]|nr:MAG: Polysaccharide biosynthesis protein [archaeon ADurb.Bin336]
MIQFILLKYFSNKETLDNFFWRSLQIFGKQGITFLIFIVCAFLLPPFEFGIYNYILAIIYFLIMFGDFGISTSVSKYVAEYSLTDKNKLRNVLFSSGALIFGLTIIITVLTVLFGEFYLKENYIYILYLLPMLFLSPMTSLYDGIYRGLKRFKELAIISIIVGIISIFMIYFLIINFGLLGALIAQNLFYLILLIVLAVSYRDFDLKINKQLIKEIGTYSLLVGLSTMGLFLYTRVDIIVLGYFGLIEEIAYYEIINKIFTIILLPVTILATVVAPNTTKNFALKKFKYLKQKILKESIALFFIGLFVSIILFFVAPFSFQIVFQEYNPLILMNLLSIFLILIPLRYFSTYLTVGYITPSGNAKILTKYLIFFGIVNLILDLLLIEQFGLIGVVYATLISQILFIFFKDIVSFLPMVFRNAKI